ncbi:MAG TPA: pyrroline-5-carboxylate reductase dimerization domain-containing protein [Gammaproteobacteria bacterium]|nr:pyrroline-5-carboxylate reductase dimerization domain-containing protein [Gammaproteobacteria bacterium]
MNLLLIGCGNIGGTLLKLWSAMSVFQRIVVVQPSMKHAAHYQQHQAIEFVNNIKEVPADFAEDVLVLAVKPQQLNDILPGLSTRNSNAILVSLLAGTKTEHLSSASASKIIHLMPNVAIKTGKSVNLAYATQNLQLTDVAKIEEIFQPTGKITWLSTDEQIELLAPFSACGPAYFFLLAELLVGEAVKVGINADVARNIMQQTFVGTASLVEGAADYDALIKSVASKKGVTEAALDVLRPDLTNSLSKAISAALSRSKELVRENSR